MESYPRHEEARVWGMVCHLSALVGYVLPLGNVLAPLVIWLLKRDIDPFVDEQGKASLNFQLSMLVYFFLSLLLVMEIVGDFMLVIFALVDIIQIILASVEANQGRSYRYRMSIRFIP